MYNFVHFEILIFVHFKFIIYNNITYAFLAHAVSAATQFIVCSVGIGDVPQQAKLQGVYHLALLATIVSRKNRTLRQCNFSSTPPPITPLH